MLSSEQLLPVQLSATGAMLGQGAQLLVPLLERTQLVCGAGGSHDRMQ